MLFGFFNFVFFCLFVFYFFCFYFLFLSNWPDLSYIFHISFYLTDVEEVRDMYDSLPQLEKDFDVLSKIGEGK